MLKQTVFDLAKLEARLLFCVDHGLGLDSAFGTYPANVGPSLLMGTETTTGGATGSVAIAGGVPAYSSNPGAAGKLFIDFNGTAAQTGGSCSVPATPAYDQDGDATTFSDAEFASIKDNW